MADNEPITSDEEPFSLTPPLSKREQAAATMRAWRAANPDKVEAARIRNRPKTTEERETYNARKRAERLANPEVAKTAKAKYRAKPDTHENELTYHRVYNEANKELLRVKAQERRDADPEKAKEIDRRHREKNHDKILARNRAAHPAKYLHEKYSLTPAEFQAMQATQGHRCPVCKTPFNPDMRGFHPCIDHDHATGKVRGVLCRLCNTGIGQMRDNPKWLRAAARYLERHAKEAATDA